MRDAMTAGFRFPVDKIVLEKVYRFPVLAHWSFTCTGAGSFETLMQGLDVGLLGDQLNVKQNAPSNQNHWAFYAGLGIHF